MIKDLKNVLRCPSCEQVLSYERDCISCSNCKNGVLVEGRLINFRKMSPELHLDFAKYTEKLHEYAGCIMKDMKPDFRIQSVLQMVRQRARGRICLEIGGGDGPMTPELERLFDIVLTTDFSEHFLKRIESKTSKALCLYNDAHFLPIQDGTIDTIICSEVLQHVAVPTQLLSEIRRVMKRKRVCILSVPNEANRMSFYADRGPKRLEAGDSHINFYNPDTLTKLLFRMGLEVIEIRTLKPTHVSLKSFVRNPLTFLTNRLTGQYILCLLRIMNNPRIYWETLEKRLKQ